MGTHYNIHGPGDDRYYYCPDLGCPCHGNPDDRSDDHRTLAAAFDSVRNIVRAVFRLDRRTQHDESTCYICRPDLVPNPELRPTRRDDDKPRTPADRFRDDFLEFSGIDLYDPLDRPDDIDDALKRFEARVRHPSSRKQRP